MLLPIFVRLSGAVLSCSIEGMSCFWVSLTKTRNDARDVASAKLSRRVHLYLRVAIFYSAFSMLAETDCKRNNVIAELFDRSALANH